jgi:hypothetical protein
MGMICVDAAVCAGSTPAGAKAQPEAASTNSSALSWLPFPALSVDVSWTDLADSDDDLDLECPGPMQRGPRSSESLGASVSGASDEQKRADSKGGSSTLIPSFSGQPLKQAGREQAGDSFGLLESPTPVALVHEVSSPALEPSRTQFGFTLGTSLPDRASVASPAPPAARKASGAGLRSQWSTLHFGDLAGAQAAELVVEPRLEPVCAPSGDERVCADACEVSAATPRTPLQGLWPCARACVGLR